MWYRINGIGWDEERKEIEAFIPSDGGDPMKYAIEVYCEEFKSIDCVWKSSVTGLKFAN